MVVAMVENETAGEDRRDATRRAGGREWVGRRRSEEVMFVEPVEGV